MLDYETTIDFCVKHDISIEAFAYAYLLYLDKKLSEGVPLRNLRPNKTGPSSRPLSQVYRYHELVRDWNRQDIQRLLKKEFLTETPPPVEIEHRRMGGEPRYYPDYLEVTSKFADAVMATEDRFEEFWDEYPASIPGFNNPAERVRLRAVDKDDIEKLYYKRVRSRLDHEDLMTALRWAKSNSLININIKNYLAGENWKDDLQQMKEGVNTGGTLI